MYNICDIQLHVLIQETTEEVSDVFIGDYFTVQHATHILQSLLLVVAVCHGYQMYTTNTTYPVYIHKAWPGSRLGKVC